MKWVTRKRIQVNRAAAAWLVRRFIDPQAEFLFVEPDKAAGVQALRVRPSRALMSSASPPAGAAPAAATPDTVHVGYAPLM